MSRPFKFKQFSVHQSANSQKVGTDSMLLGAWVGAHYNRILDIGTGTGILALMMAQKNPKASITAIEPDFDSYQEACLNFQQSPFKTQLLAINSPLQQFGSIEKFDLIICNPPYFENAYLSDNKDRNRTRHTNDLPVFELYEHAADLITVQGHFALIIPHNEEDNHLQYASKEGFIAQKILRTVREDGTFKRSLIQFGIDSAVINSTAEIEVEITTILVKDSSNRYSEEYIQLTKHFYSKDLSQQS